MKRPTNYFPNAKRNAYKPAVTCEADGCDDPVRYTKLGRHCAKHYQRVKKHGDASVNLVQVSERWKRRNL